MYSADLNVLTKQLGLAGLLSPRKPSNQVTRSGSNVRGIYPSPFSWPTTWASSGERRLIRTSVLSPSVLELRTQPVTLRIPGLDKRGEYTPDAAALVRAPGRSKPSIVLVECKQFDVANSQALLSRHAVIREALARIDVPFIVLTEEELPQSLDANLNLVLRHEKFRRSAGERVALEKRVRAGRFERYGDLANAVGTVDALHALANAWLNFNHFEPLTLNSALSTDMKEGWDAARHLYTGL